jgi:hypothetical protein
VHNVQHALCYCLKLFVVNVLGHGTHIFKGTDVIIYAFLHPTTYVNKKININPLEVQFKSLLHGQEGFIFFSGHLNVRKYQYVLVRLGWQEAFKSSTL